MRIVFMGTDEFAVPALESLVKGDVELVCVITQPDQPKGRGLKMMPPPVKETALEYNLPVYQPEKVREKGFIEKMRNEFKPDMIVVTAFGQILPKAILDLPPYGCINIHPSLLPKYRGAAPIQRAIINGESVTGITIMFMDEGEDTGDIIAQKVVEIGISDSAEVMFHKLAKVGAEMLCELLQKEPLMLPRKPQDHSKASYAPKLTKEDGLINWHKSAFEIHNLIRGTIPWPVAYTTFKGKTLRIWESALADHMSDAKTGTIVDITPGSEIVSATGDKCLLVLTVQPANKAKMKARDFVNGYKIKKGDIFGEGVEKKK